SFAELSSAIPRAGGAYNFSRIAFGRGASFLSGWMEWFASSLAGAFYAIVFAEFSLEYINQLLNLGIGEGLMFWLTKAVSLFAAGVFIYINYRGSSETGKIGAIFTVAQMTFVLGLGVVGVITFCVNPERIANFQPFMPHGWWKLLGAMGVIYVAFEGFEVIAQAGDETVDPKRNMPKAMLYSVAIVTVTYVVVAFATVVSVSPDSVPEHLSHPWEVIAQHQDKGFRKAASSLMPWGLGGLIVTLAVIFSSTSALNATIYSATRASYALGRDRMLPGRFGKVSARRRTPVTALAFTSLIVLTAAALLDPKNGAATASIMFLFLFFVVNLCVIKIRRNMGDELEYGYVMPWFPLFPILAILCQAGLAGGIVHESMVAWIIGPAWVLTGLGIYWFYSRHHAVTTEDEIHVFSQDRTGAEPPEPGRERIMVSVANPDNALSMVRTTYKLCTARKAPKVDLLHMVPVPAHVPLSDAEQYMLEGKEGILETMLYLAPMFPITTHMRYCRSISRGIISACREKRASMLIMGWHGRPNSGYFHMGSTIDPILERAPSDVVILKDTGGNQTFKRVLVPLAGGPNSALALEVASILADSEQGQVTCFHIVGGGRGQKFDVNEFLTENESRLHIPAERLEVKVVPRRPVVQAILCESEDYDLVVLGSTRDSMLRKMTHTPVPETIARECTKPIAMVRSGSGVRSWIRRWI
ncbi:MAG: amino acid permease, partial [Planctomycetota bacterium]